MLSLEIDWRDLQNVADELQASSKQIAFALSRALRRTEASLRRLSMRGLPPLLGLRAVSVLRKRMKSIKVRKMSLQKGDGAGLWYGLNDLPVSSFKGRPRQIEGGATFGGQTFDGAFVARSRVKGKRTIFKRDGKKRLHITEQSMPIADEAIVFLEDEVFNEVEKVFWQHFERDLKARVKYQLGSKR